ncbi:MAG: PEP-CTERM sorting domain-containing protein, partial [Myxococcales bacterium]|nr:PEP-CTERM sorting domain-containing protein [Myxococcales bacterium]
ATGNDLTRFRPIGLLGGTQTTFLTDPANPTLLTLIGTGHLNTTRTFTPFTGISKTVGQTKPAINGINTLPLPGKSKVCIIVPGCGIYIPVPFTQNGTVGLGVGGTITANTFSKGAGLKVSVVAQPWTIGVTSVSDVETRNHALSATEKTTGFVHGPASATSTAAQAGGVIQIVTAALVTTSLSPPDNRQAQLSFGRFVFVPEPGMVLLLGSGVGGLLLVGRRRMRR